MTGQEKVSNWRSFRLGLEHVDDKKEQLSSVVRYFENIEIEDRNIDFYSPDTFLSPWELLFNDKFCISSLTLLMYHTLAMTESVIGDLELILISDHINTQLIVKLDEYVINYEDMVVNIWTEIEPSVKVLATYTL